MKVITSISQMQKEVQSLKNDKLSIGYVPTMGYLHEGHVRLVKKAREDNDIVIMSIFVNPLQFGPNEDLDAYPRDFERDSEIAKNEKVDYIFYPSVEEMYPSKPSVTLVVQKRVDVLCGSTRPGHFDGVATVLAKLFHIIQPARAYFGMKDAQQVAVVDGLISDLHFPIELISVETVREEDGLAKSSRNVRLTSKEREEASILYKSLTEAEIQIRAGEKDIEAIISNMRKMISNNSTGTVDYIEIYSYPELENLEVLEGKVIIALAVKFSNARLIDNLVLTI
ncbi:pantoate--beta-alanine ligase [Robertmurraya korlensis]|uniref:pantoate--beta-alanine ligase n=1 Tax=Robertmurraya korlensis TaxID=519977 RepID=UPI00203E9870|nr:pantoate--beta-alanine ligase [Robertmurraya korlensis]MCM3599806.1 pantoate--beta-alanine ligase [Robertmurraya korlensis]